MSHPLNHRSISSGWNYRGKPLIQDKRESYDEPELAKDVQAKTAKDRKVLFWPDVEDALFLIDPARYGYPVIWFPTFGHGTSEPFEEFPQEPGEVAEKIMLEVAKRASVGIDDLDGRLAAVLERLKTE